jgi:hypothetical protein
MKELFATILAHTVPHLPNFILRQWYSSEKLASRIQFRPPRFIGIDYARHELQMWLPVTNHLPFSVTLKHLEFDVKIERTARLVPVLYSRSNTLKPNTDTIVEIPILKLNQDQLDWINGKPIVLWVFGQADLEGIGTSFNVRIEELSCAATILNHIPAA